MYQKVSKTHNALVLVENLPLEIHKLSVNGLNILTLNDSYKPEEIDALIVFHAKDIEKINIKEFKRLKLIKSITAGVDHIPEDVKRRYVVLGTHGPNAKYIAEHALSLALACSRKLIFHTNSMKKGEFHQVDLYHKTLFKSNILVLGFGPLGRYTAGLFKRTFESVITVYKKSPKIHHLYKNTVKYVITDFEELINLLPSYDVVINTLPLNNKTRGIIDKRFFSKLKEDVIIVNVSRGKVIDEKDLFYFLKTHRKACAGIDVWYRYPKKNEKFRQNFPFHELENIVMTPHNAPVVKGYFYNMLKSAIYQLKWDLSKL